MCRRLAMHVSLIKQRRWFSASAWKDRKNLPSIPVWETIFPHSTIFVVYFTSAWWLKQNRQVGLDALFVVFFICLCFCFVLFCFCFVLFCFVFFFVYQFIVLFSLLHRPLFSKFSLVTTKQIISSAALAPERKGVCWLWILTLWPTIL